MDHPPTPTAVPLALTPFERTLILMLAAGLTTGQIATRTSTAAPTVRGRIGRLRRRVGAQTTAQMIHQVHVLGLMVEPRQARPLAPAPPTLSATDPAPARSTPLTPKPRAGTDDARLIAARLEASFRGGAR